MNGKTINNAFAGAVRDILDIRFTKAATRYSGRCVDIRNLSVRWKNLALYFTWSTSGVIRA